MARTLIVSDRHNSFFSANNIRVGNRIPTEGNYVKGDIIVNTGNLSSDAMWICIESGNPGLWEVVGAGSGTTGGGSTVVSISDTVFVNEPVREVSLEGLDVIITSSDKLTVHHNSVHLMEGIDYKIEGNKIVKLTEGYWNEDSEEAMFAFELLKNVEQVDGSLVEVKTKLVCMQNTVTVQGAVREVLIGIQGFNKDYDTLMVFENETFLTRGVNYEINEAGNGIVPVGGEVWNDIMIDDWSYTFVVFKDVPLVEGETKIGMGQLAEDVKEAIENASNIDLSEYATKEEVNGKVAQTEYDAKIAELENRVNEAFTNANNGKQLIASAIGEPVSSEDTFQAMSTDINGLLSTFKANMMNNGITVESGDRFKSLIDKIATMVEEGSGKGIRYVQGSYTYTSEKSASVTVQTNLGFIPQYFVVVVNGMYVSGVNDLSASGNKYMVLTTDCPYHGYQMIWSDGGTSSDRVLNLAYDANSFTISGGQLKYVHFQNGVTFNWHAFGVGEEDNTLRDSLASILQEEGVSVTNEDNMASLISKVDQEFDRQVVPAGDAVAANVLNGKTFINSTGQVVTGSMTEHGYYTDYAGYLTTNDKNMFVGIQPGAYLSSTGSGYPEILIPKSRVNNLSPENIVSGKEILGVWGTATASSLGGKRITSGTGTVTANGNSHRQLIVTGLPFRPRIVFVQSQSAAIRYVSNIDFGAIYVRGDTGGAGYFSCYNTDTTDPSTLASNIRNGNSYMGPNWFGMYVVDSVGASVSWIAWE